MPLTQEQINIVKSTVPILEEHGVTITSRFYQNVLNDNPALRNIFSKTHQDTGHQAQALAGSVYAYAANIDNLGALGPVVELIAHKHASLHIQPEHYVIVGTYLLAAMKEILGDALTPEIHDAWKAAYFQLADIFIGREKELYDLAGPKWADWRSFKISRKVRETDEITSFYLVSPDGEELPTWKPGQYISVRVPVPELGYLQPRQYSLSDAPGKGYFRISVKREKPTIADKATYPAFVSNILHDKYNEGDLLEVTHPYGDFFVDTAPKSNGCPFHKAAEVSSNAASVPASTPLILIAAGVGITPMMAILQSLLSDSTASTQYKPLTLLHGAPRASMRPFTSDIAALRSKDGANLRTVYWNSKADADAEVHKTDSPVESDTVLNFEGRMQLDNVKDLLEERGLRDEKAQVYVCGPVGFMEGVASKLKQWGIKEEHVHLERFGTGGVSVK